LLLEPPHLHGHGERRAHAGRDRARAGAHAQLGRLCDGRARQEQSDESKNREERFHVVLSLVATRAGTRRAAGVSTSAVSTALFSDGSQNSTRRRTRRIARLRRSPTTDRISSTENCPDTSMVKFIDWMSMPRPDVAPTNSATMAPISAKIIAMSSPAMTNGSA